MAENNEFQEPTESQEFGEGSEIPSEEGQQGFARVRIPRGREVIGKVETRAGANRMIVSCFDGKTRNCRVPGRLKRALWIRPGNVVLIEPWEFEGDKKGDIIFSYTPAAVSWLERKGYLKGITNEF